MLARSCLTIAALALCCTAAGAQQPFYAGKQLTILVNYDAGGPTDLEARVLSRHIGRHIAGNPRIIVQNMGGAGGIVGTKYLGEIAPRDGTMLGYFTGSTQRYVSNSRALQRRLPHLRVHRSAAERPHPFHADRRAARHQERCRRHQRREHRGRRAAARRAEGYGDAADARHARRALHLRDRIQFQRPGDDRAPARRDQLLRRLASPLQNQDRTRGEGRHADPGVLRPQFRRQGLHRAGLHEGLRDPAFPRALQIDQRRDARSASFGSCTSPSCWSTAPCTGC